MVTRTASYPPTRLTHARWVRYDRAHLVEGETGTLAIALTGERHAYDPLAADPPAPPPRPAARPPRQPEGPRSPRLLNALLDLKITPQAAARFAEEWGLLGIDIHFNRGVFDLGRPDGRIESFDDWAKAVGLLQKTFQLWSAIRNGDRATMRATLAPARKAGGPYAADDRRAAIELLQDLANGWLFEHTARAVVYEEDQDRLGYRDVPRSLIGAAWLQLAEEIARSGPTRECPCGRWYLVKAKPGNDRYCGRRCRKAYAKRRARARTLHAERRVAPAEIARRMNVEPRLVREWLRAGRKR